MPTLQEALTAHGLAQSLLRRVRRSHPDWSISFPPIEDASDPEQLRQIDIAFANNVRERLRLSVFPEDANSLDVMRLLANASL